MFQACSAAPERRPGTCWRDDNCEETRSGYLHLNVGAGTRYKAKNRYNFC